MANMLNLLQQMNKQREKFREKTAKYQSTLRKRQEQSEQYLLKKLSKEMKVDFKSMVEEVEKRRDADRVRIRPGFDKLKAEARRLALQNRRRYNQAIKAFAKQGIIKGYHKLYPNQPNLRMKYAQDWEGTCTPITMGGMTGGEAPEDLAYASCDFFFDQELDANGNPVVIPGHAGLCNKFRARCIARAGGERRISVTSTATQTLIFRHDPPSVAPDIEYCGFSELWIPMSLTGTSQAMDSDRVFFIATLDTEGGLANIYLSIRIEQDTDHGPSVYPVTTDDYPIHRHTDVGGHWIFAGMEPIDWAPRVIDYFRTVPYRLPPMTLLSTAEHGGREVRVVVTLTCSAGAINRHAEAEIDLSTDGFGAEIYDVMLRGAGCIGSFTP